MPISPVSSETHKEYKEFSIPETVQLYNHIKVMADAVTSGKRPPYTADTYIRHAVTNREVLHNLIKEATLLPNGPDIKIPASYLFWIYRGSTSTGERCPVVLPHICKIRYPDGERFYATTKEEWMKHRESVGIVGLTPRISDHAKLQYLSRVCGINIDLMLQSFPAFQGKSVLLDDGRREFISGSHSYIIQDNVCITVLDKAMVTT